MTEQNIATVQDILDALDQNPDLQREFHRHLVQVIRNDDDLRQELRKEILTEELLQLPARFTRLEEDVAELKTDVAELKTDVAELKTDVAELKTDVAELKTDVAELKTDVAELKTDVAELKTDVTELKAGQARMSGQIANLTGRDYETRAIEGSRRLVRRELGMEQATLLYASKQTAPTSFETGTLIPAIREGRISRQQGDELEEADCIIRCEDPDGAVVCAVVEISVTVQDHDRRRAAERAEIFALASGLRTLPFVVGQEQEERGPQAPEVPFLQY